MKTKLTAMVLAAGAALGAAVLEVSPEVVEIVYTLEDGEVVDTFGKVWRR